MHTRETLKRERNRAILVWLPIALVLTPVAVVGLLQAAYVNDFPFFSEIAKNCYQNFSLIKDVWDSEWVPLFYYDDGIGLEDILCGVLVVFWFWACLSAQNFWALDARYTQLKKEAEDENIKGGF